MEGNKRIYHDEKGEEIGTYKEDLDCIVRVKLAPLRDFLNMLTEDNEAQKVIDIGAALLEAAEGKIYEATEYLQKNYGMVELERARHHQSIKPGTILGIVFTPCEEVPS